MTTGEVNDYGLPAAGELIREAIVLARDLTSGPHHFERARLLLDLARELREDVMRRSMLWQQARWFDKPAGDPPRQDDPADFPVSAPLFREAETEIMQRPVSDREVAEAAFGPDLKPVAERLAGEATEVMPRASRCRHDALEIVYRHASPEHPVPGWYHTRTGQMVCPTDLYPNTFAEPVPAQH